MGKWEWRRRCKDLIARALMLETCHMQVEKDKDTVVIDGDDDALLCLTGEGSSVAALVNSSWLCVCWVA